jgi:hypothetical protein
LAFAWLVFFAVAMIIAALTAKYLMIMGAYWSGMGLSVFKIYAFLTAAAVCTGFMFAAPLWSAMFFAMTPFSRRVRLTVALAWFAVAMTTQFVGTQALPDFDSPTIFRPETLTVLPILTLGWCIPFVLMRVFRGWQIQFPGSDSQTVQPLISITSLMTATLLVALCLAALRLGDSSVQFVGLVGMLVAMGLGFVAVPLVWCLMRTKHYFVFSIGLVAFIFAVVYLVQFWIYGPTQFALLTPLLIVAFAQGIAALLVGARLYGATLITNRTIQLQTVPLTDSTHNAG